MARTYWAPKGQDWEFLGAYQDKHQVKDKASPQARGSILDLEGMGVQDVLDKLDGRVKLAGLPANWTRRMVARMPTSLKWSELEGYVK